VDDAGASSMTRPTSIFCAGRESGLRRPFRPSHRLGSLWTMRDFAQASDDPYPDVLGADSDDLSQRRRTLGRGLAERRYIRDNAISMLLRGGLAGAILGFFLTGNVATGLVAVVCLFVGVGIGWLGRGIL